MPTAVSALQANGCNVQLDDGVTIEGAGNSDIDVLRLWRDREPGLQRVWLGDDPKDWEGVEFKCDRVVKLELNDLDFGDDKLTSLPAEIGQLTSLTVLDLEGNQLTSLPAEIGQLTSLEKLYLDGNKLTSVPAEIGQLTSLTELYLQNNKLTSLPAEIGQLTSLRELNLYGNRLRSVPAAAIRKLRAAGCYVWLDDGVTFAE